MTNLEDLTQQVVEACKYADQHIIEPIRNGGALGLQDKDNTGRNLVTQADLQTEAFLKTKLKQLFPEAGFIAEESNETEQEMPFHWIIDPIDGTTNFVHGLPPFAISVALAKGTDILVGVIYELFTKECFCAWKGGGAWCNGRALNVSKTQTLDAALLCTGFPYDQGNEALFQKWIGLLTTFLRSTRGVRRLGAASVDMAYVAAGRLDAFYEYNLQPWDVAAGSLIVTEAHGQVTDFSGGDDHLFGRQLIASNGLIHKELIESLSDFRP